VSVYVEVKAYPDVAVNVDSLMVVIMVVIMVSITVAVTASVTVMDTISDTAAITVQTMAATATWHTTGPTTPIPELLSLHQGLT
jgi:hypothetical protein